MKVDEGLIRDIFRLFVWFPLRWSVGVVPVRWAFYIFKLMGDAHYLGGGRKKRVISENLKNLLGLENGDAPGIVMGNFENHYTDRLHIFLYPRLRTRDSIERFLTFENREILDGELKGGRGALLVQPHFGPVQITLLALSLYGYDPIQVGYPTDRGLSRVGRSVAYRYRLRYEGMLPSPIIAADRFLGPVYKHLLNNGVVLTTGDGAGGGVYLGEHRELEFLNTRRPFPLGPAALSLRTGASYIPTFITTEGPARFRIVFEEPIRPRYGEMEKDKLFMTEAFRTIAEGYIRRYPQSWHFWDEVGRDFQSSPARTLK